MMADTVVRARIDGLVKEEAANVLGKMGRAAGIAQRPFGIKRGRPASEP